jgi:hypothetical protein
VPFFAQAAAQQLTQARLIFHHENLHRPTSAIIHIHTENSLKCAPLSCTFQFASHMMPASM